MAIGVGRAHGRPSGLAVCGVLGAVVLAGCGGSAAGDRPGAGPPGGPSPAAGRPADPPPDGAPRPALPHGWRWVAYADVPRVEVFERPGDDLPRWTLGHPNPRGVPLVLGVERRDRDWLRVKVPVRPNGSVGWVRGADVEITTTSYELVVDRSEHRLTVRRAGEVIARLPVGIGTGSTPTPSGEFYLTELLRPDDPNGPWGPFAFGLSGFSDMITQFNGAEGIIGLHGTNRPDLVGSDVSLGCIRLRNEDLLRLVDTVPLGTPVTIAG